MSDQQPTDAKQCLRKRRSQRIELNVPVVVHRPPKYGPQFYESTQTMVVSAHGGLGGLTETVAPKQRLLGQNVDSGEQQECCVLYVARGLIGPPTMTVEFRRPRPRSWRIALP